VTGQISIDCVAIHRPAPITVPSSSVLGEVGSNEGVSLLLLLNFLHLALLDERFSPRVLRTLLKHLDCLVVLLRQLEGAALAE